MMSELLNHQISFAKDVVKLLSFILIKGYEFTFGETTRLKSLAKVLSLHPDRLAIDINLFKDGVYLKDTPSYNEVGAYWISLSPYNEWGGEGKRGDGNHFSRSPDGERW